MDCKEKAVITINHIDYGHTYNVIPRTAVMEGTFRAFDMEIIERLRKRIAEIVHGIAEAHRLEVDTTDPITYMKYPPVINHKKEADHVERVAKEVFGKDNFTTAGTPVFASEDFSEYLLEKPGAFLFI